MKPLRIIIAGLFCFWAQVLAPSTAPAAESGHYMPGIEGIKLATAPPPGFYYKIYNIFYYSDTLKAHRTAPRVKPDIQDFIMVHRPIWVTNWKILGGDYITTLLIPLTFADVHMRKYNLRDRTWALGDIGFEPFCLDWHKTRWDAMFSLAVFMPTGNHSARRPALPGKDFWTLLVSLGPTFHLDHGKTWAVSGLMRYELHSKKRDEDIRPGDDVALDVSISKSLGRLWEVGLCGYGHWQITDDRGRDVYYDKNIHDRVFGIGPEIDIFVPFLKMKFQLRTQFEFGARDRTEGIITNLSYTKTF